MNRCSFAACITALLLTPCITHAGVISGVLHAPPLAVTTERSMNAYPGRANAMPGMHAIARGALTDAVVYVERISASAESALAAVRHEAPRFAQRNQAFVPRVLPVALGTRVEFPNMDPIYHNVFSLSQTKRFDLGKYPRGKSKPVVFNRCGLVNVYCDIHSDMEGFILVVPNHCFTSPSAAGEYSLPEIPPGRYTLKIWHPDFESVTRTVEVPDSGPVTVDLSF